MWRTYHTAAVCLVINVCLYFYVNSTVFLIVLTVFLFGFFGFHQVSIKYFNEVKKPRSQTKIAVRYFQSKTMSTSKSRNISDICNDSSFDIGLLNNYESRLSNPKLKRDSLWTSRDSVFDNRYQDEILKTSQLWINDNSRNVDLPSPIRPLRDSPSRVFKPSPLPFSSKRVSNQDVGGEVSSPAAERSGGAGHFPWLGLSETCYSPVLIKTPPSAYASPTDSSHGGTPRQTAKIRLSRLNKSELSFSEPAETIENAEESTTKSVIQVLKAISRKRVYMPADDDEEEVIHQAKRRPPEHNLSMARLEGDEESPYQSQQLPGREGGDREEDRGKRCRTADWDLPSTSLAKKRRKNSTSFYNNEVYSSYSSSRFMKKGGVEMPSAVESSCVPPARLSEPSATTHETKQPESTPGDNYTNGQTIGAKDKPKEMDISSEKDAEAKKVEVKKPPPPFAKTTIAKEPMTVTKPMADAILKSTIEKLLLSGEKLSIIPSSSAPGPTGLLAGPTTTSTASTSASALFGSSLTQVNTTTVTSPSPIFNFAKPIDAASPKSADKPPESEKLSGFSLLQETSKEAPKIAQPSGFTFGATEQPKTTETSKTTISPFAFGAATTSESPKLSFGAPSTQPAVGGFKLPDPSQATTAPTTTTAVPSFSFGSTPSPVPATSSLSTTVTASQVPPVTSISTESKTDFKFVTGNLSSGIFKLNENPTDESKGTTKEPQKPQAIFSFGGNKPVESKPEEKKPEEPKPFQFGGGTAQKESIPGGFSFGSNISKPSGGSLFTTAAPLATTTASSTFGVTAPGFNAGSMEKKENKPGGFSFSATATTTAATTTAEQKSVFSFSGATTSQASSAPPAFGSAVQSAFGSAPTPTFGSTALGATNTTSTFGSSAATTATPAPVFGSLAATTATPVFGSSVTTAVTPVFGSSVTTAVTPVFGSSVTTAVTPVFGSSATTTATPAPAFGSSATTTTPVFGSSATTTATPAPVFGSLAATTTTSVFGSSSITTATTTPVFGSSPATTATPVFGSSAAGTATPAPVFGSSSTMPTFGSATTSTPTFGSAQTAAPTFGSQATPTFGSSAFGQNQSTPSFGSSSTTSAFGSSAPAFGTPALPTSSTPAFGSSTPAPTFGSTAVQPAAPAFGSATPAFGSAPSFGSAAAPSFGAAPSGGSTFGTAESKPFTFGAGAQPAAPASSGFNFTAPQTPAPPAAGGLFQFGAGAASPAPAQPFQFNAAQPSPAGFAASFTPGVGGSQQMFSIGSGSTAPRSRPARRKK